MSRPHDSSEPRWTTIARVCELLALMGPERFVEVRLPYVLDSVALAIGTRVVDDEEVDR